MGKAKASMSGSSTPQPSESKNSETPVPPEPSSHVQLIDKDPTKSISMFWSAINAGDQVDTSLMGMVLLMKQMNRTGEAIEAIKSFRHLCSVDIQESLDFIIADDLFDHVARVPKNDSPYHMAKKLQGTDPNKSISLFWSAINARDRVYSAVRDMVALMKQMDRTDEAIEAIKSFKPLCTDFSRDLLRNVLIDLYKTAGRFEECLELIKDVVNNGQLTEAKSLLLEVKPSAAEREMEDPFIKYYDFAKQFLHEQEAKSALDPLGCRRETLVVQKPKKSSRNRKKSSRNRKNIKNESRNDQVDHDLFSSSDEAENVESSDEEGGLEWEEAKIVPVRILRKGVEEQLIALDLVEFLEFCFFRDSLTTMLGTGDFLLTYSEDNEDLLPMEAEEWAKFHPSSITVWLL